MNIEDIKREHFVAVFNELKKRKEIVKYNRAKSKSSFAKKIFGGKRKETHVLDRLLGKSKIKAKVSSKVIENLHKYYLVNKAYLYGEDVPMFVEDIKKPQGREAVVIPIGKNKIVHLSSMAACAGPSIEADLSYEEDQEENIYSLPRLHGEFVSFQVEGASMEPTIFDEDVVICQKLGVCPSRIASKDIFVVVKKDNSVMLKRIEEKKDKSGRLTHYMLISDNEEADKVRYAPISVPIEEVEEIYKVERWLTSPR